MTEPMIADHRPDAKRVRSRCVVDCSCGWRGRLVSTFGEGDVLWRVHFYDEAERG